MLAEWKMVGRISSGAFLLAILVWLALALGWIPGGFPVVAVTSIGCLSVSYFCYRIVRVKGDAKQVAQLRVMQREDGMSDEELLSYVALHHPNLLDGFFRTFGAGLWASVKAKKDESNASNG